MESCRKNKIQIVCLLDGRPGHEKQTLGIVRSLEKRVPIKIIKINVSRVPLWQTVWRIICLNLPGSPGSGSGVQGGVKADLIIGTGSQTHLQLLLYKKRYNVPAITCMAPDPFLRYRFDLCFVPLHDGLKSQDNIVNTVGPPNCSENKKCHKKDVGLILVGGIDKKSHSWKSSAIVEKIEVIVRHYASVKWVISSSPRTPGETVLQLEKLSARWQNVRFFNYKDTEPGWVERQYDRSAIVWVSADSVSMMFEALTAGCRVGVIPVDWKRSKNKFMQSVAFLENNGFVLAYEQWVEGQKSWLKPDNLNEAQRCADMILRRWWPKNLQ